MGAWALEDLGAEGLNGFWDLGIWHLGAAKELSRSHGLLGQNVKDLLPQERGEVREKEGGEGGLPWASKTLRTENLVLTITCQVSA